MGSIDTTEEVTRPCHANLHAAGALVERRGGSPNPPENVAGIEDVYPNSRIGLMISGLPFLALTVLLAVLYYRMQT